ncbi:OPLAH [Lepeophtheirus salmonis]|uniref:OPLAH n=1 Tax=Lepeophtheirus salmonis TaxID=72036 RepID=A0A7R8H199_LEPSM|nr:OPLAH [Lepeophtheirus salmonis]CAF2807577.1 OPLAH [Lepeophtheirus salmonis]
MAMESKFRFAIDRGGTFTDIFAVLPHGKGVRVMKLLSEDPRRYEDAPTEGMRRIMEETLGKRVSLPLDASFIEDVRMGTTVATNALLERKGTRTALLLNSGFQDLWHIGDQTRPDLFDLKACKPDQLYTKTVSVQERIIPRREGDTYSSVQSLTTGESFSSHSFIPMPSQIMNVLFKILQQKNSDFLMYPSLLPYLQ